MTKPSSTAVKERYDRAVALKTNITQGILALEELIEDQL
jgi:hypothetical protein